ncbi:MAG: HAD family hydrolase [Deltaproteobacteria bacterium]|nr:HAD family hydrolase [Deltaproteobacteria bacterium]
MRQARLARLGGALRILKQFLQSIGVTRHAAPRRRRKTSARYHPPHGYRSGFDRAHGMWPRRGSGAKPAAPMPYPVLLFGLFRTIVRFTRHAPTGQVKEPTWRPAMNQLRGRAQALLGEIEFGFFLDALYDASLALAKARGAEQRETPIAERYRRALARLGVEGADADATAARLATLQLEALLANVELPTAHAALLRELAATRRLAVISNFDDGPTVHALLERLGLTPLLAATVVSVEVGRRKPHAEIFAAALRQLDAAPRDALMIGDSLTDDVAGAAAAGIDTVWVNWDGIALPAGGVRPTYEVRELVHLRALPPFGDIPPFEKGG